MPFKNNGGFTRRGLGRALLWVGVAVALYLTGCGGGRLIPRDLKDFVSADLKMERRRVELTQPFRTTMTLRVNAMPVANARQANREFIESCLKYFQRDGVTDFINDTLIFEVRLDADPKVCLKWTTVTMDMRALVKDKMGIEEFIERCRKEEHWTDEFEQAEEPMNSEY